jgi:hypothetical protein
MDARQKTETPSAIAPGVFVSISEVLYGQDGTAVTK